MSWEDVLCEVGCARLSARWSYYVARQRRKDSRRLGRGLVGPPFGAQMAALAAQGLQAQSGTFSRSIPQASVVFY